MRREGERACHRGAWRRAASAEPASRDCRACTTIVRSDCADSDHRRDQGQPFARPSAADLAAALDLLRRRAAEPAAAAVFFAGLPALRRSRLAGLLDAFYARHRPDKRGDAPAVAAGYEGRCGALAARLQAAYGAGLDEFDGPHPAPAVAATADGSSARGAGALSEPAEPRAAAEGLAAGERLRLSRRASLGPGLREWMEGSCEQSLLLKQG